MTEINDFVQDFWRTPDDGADGESYQYLAMRRLLEILQECFHILKCVSIFIPVFEIAVGLLVDKKFQMSADPNCPDYSAQLDLDETEIKDKFKIS